MGEFLLGLGPDVPELFGELLVQSLLRQGNRRSWSARRRAATFATEARAGPNPRKGRRRHGALDVWRHELDELLQVDHPGASRVEVLEASVRDCLGHIVGSEEVLQVASRHSAGMVGAEESERFPDGLELLRRLGADLLTNRTQLFLLVSDQLRCDRAARPRRLRHQQRTNSRAPIGGAGARWEAPSADRGSLSDAAQCAAEVQAGAGVARGEAAAPDVSRCGPQGVRRGGKDLVAGADGRGPRRSAAWCSARRASEGCLRLWQR
mmetsp:Transcript_127506/g.366798  ORF Transcript_127506/g.366798 Transcript_127506/m.366798 type:complete len:265 (+) Transcript_127506:1063-1857(+)